MTGIPSDVLKNLGHGSRPDAAASTLANPQPWFRNWATGSGENEIAVNEFTALNYAAFYTCVSLIAGTIAALPCKVYRKRPDGGHDEADDHPAYDLLQREFNGNTSAMTGRQTEIGHLLTWGNQYTQIVRSRAGGLLELRPVGPDVVCPETTAVGDLQYKVRDRSGGEIETFRRDEFLHTPAFSFDAMVGFSTVRVAKILIRQGIGQDRRAERFVARGLKAPGAIRLKKKFKDAAEAIQFRTRFRQIHQSGGDTDDEVMILEDDSEWQSLGIDPEKAQALESRQFTRGEMAGFFHIPPHLVGDVEKTTSFGSGIEELGIGFVVYCLLPILRAIEQERNRKLFIPGRERDRGLFVEHVLAGLLRGDSLKQAQTLQIYLNLGLVTVNESRRIIGFNPVEGGNVRYYPLNMGRVDSVTGEDILPAVAAPSQPSNTPPAATTALALAGNARKLADGLRRSITAALARCLRKEAAEAAKAAKKPTEFGGWIEDFYTRHADMVGDQIGPLLDSWDAAHGTDSTGFAATHVERSRADLLAASECQPADLAGRVERCVERWHTERIADLIGGLTHATV